MLPKRRLVTALACFPFTDALTDESELTMKVFKYPISVKYSDTVVLSLPLGAQLLHVDCQHNQWNLWAMVDDQCNVFEDRSVRVAGTGHELSDAKLRHINSFLMEGGRLVFHAFEVLP